MRTGQERVLQCLTSDKAIFLFGSGRSGTTFLAKLLDSHPGILYRHEPDASVMDNSIPFLLTGDIDDQLHGQFRSYVSRLASDRNPRTCAHRPYFYKDYRSEFGNLLYPLSLALSKVVTYYFSLSVSIPDLLSKNDQRPLYLLIKSVMSLGRIRLFQEAFPECLIVHIVRHPCAVINSRQEGIRHHLMDSHTYLKSLVAAGFLDRYAIESAALNSLSLAERMAYEWMSLNQYAYDYGSKRGNYKLVIYEKFCFDIRANLRELFNNIKLDWRTETDEFIRLLEGQLSNNARYFDVLRHPESSINRWRSIMDSRTVEQVRKVTIQSYIGQMFEY